MGYHTSPQSATTPYLQKRYKFVPVIVTVLPSSVIMEGMFMVQIEPFPTMENVTGFGKTIRMGFFQKIEFHAWLISSTIELTRV